MANSPFFSYFDLTKYAWHVLWHSGRKSVWPLRVVQLKPKATMMMIHNRTDLDKILSYPIELGCGVFTEEQKQNNIYDRLILDIDTERKNILYFVYYKLVDAGIDESSIQIVYTGKKGYHIWCHIEPTYLESYRDSIISWVSDIGIVKHLDLSVFEHNRIMRVPYTWRFGNGKMTLPINVDGTRTLPDDMIFAPSKVSIPSIKGRARPYNSEGAHQIISELDLDLLPACIRAIYDKCVDHKSLNYDEYFTLGTWLASQHNLETYLDVLRQCENYDEREACNHYYYWRDHKTHTYGCKRLMSLKMCPAKCPIYPSIPAWQKAIKEHFESLS